MLYTVLMHREPGAQEVRRIAAAFLPAGVGEIARFSAGHIHASFTATSPAGNQPAILLQRINTDIFADPHALMHNIHRVTEHIAAKNAAAHRPDSARRGLAVARTSNGQVLACDAAGGYWRAYRFISRSRCEMVAKDAKSAEVCGAAFGDFLAMLADFPPPPLHQVLPGFHDTPRRFEQLEIAIARDAAGRAPSVLTEIEFLRVHRSAAFRLMTLMDAGAIPWRVAHNDAKISNVLFDQSSAEALCVVDLDLVMPGTALFDFGDMVRSMTTTAAEDESNADKVELRLDLYQGLVRGFLRATAGFLLPLEREHLFDAGVAITLEQAARFLTDYLNGDRYYSIDRPHQNLDRTRTQIALVQRLLHAEAELRKLPGAVRTHHASGGPYLPHKS